MTREELERQAAMYHAGEVDLNDTAPKGTPTDSFVTVVQPSLEEQAKLYHADVDRIEDGADAHQARRPMGRDEARLMADQLAAQYYSLPAPLKILASKSVGQTGGIIDEELAKAEKKGLIRAENLGGALAYWSSRPVQHVVTRPLLALAARNDNKEEAYFKLQQSIWERGNAHREDMPSNEQHDQLDDLVAASQIPQKSWLDRDPVRWAHRMAGDVRAEDFTIMEDFDGDSEAYSRWLDAQPLSTRIGFNAAHVIEDLFLPDPLMAVGEAGKVAKLPFVAAKAGDLALAARVLGVGTKELRGAAATAKVIEKGAIGELDQHIQFLEKALAAAPAESDQAANLQRRVWRAREEMARRMAADETPDLGIYAVRRRDPKTVYQPMKNMSVDEVAARQEAAEAIATTAEVDAAVKEQGFKNVQDVHTRMEAAHDALAAKAETDRHLSDLAAVERLPDHVKAHLAELGVDPGNVRRAAALTRSKGFEGRFIEDITDPDVIAQMSFLGLDDAQEAALGLAHMRDGGHAADLALHGVNAPELANPLHYEADGLILRHDPDYHAVSKGVTRRLSRMDSINQMLGRYTTDGLAEASIHLDGGSLTRAANKVGNAIKFGPAKFMPLSVRSFVPEITELHKKATRMYHVFRNDGEEYLRDAFVRSGMVERKGAAILTKDAAGLDHVLEMLDTPVDLAGKSERLTQLMEKASPKQLELYRDLRGWLDSWVTRLQLGEKGQAISGYFPHLFEKEKGGGLNARVLEFLGMDPKAYRSYWMLKNRTANAPGFARDAVHVLDLYNRGVSRALVMEPAFAEMEQMAQVYAKAGRHDMAAYAKTFIQDAKGLGRPSVFSNLADHMGVSQAAKDRVEGVVKQATALFYKSLLGGNLNYGLQNMAGGLTNIAAEHGPFGLLQGLLRLSTKEGLEAAKKSGILREALLGLENLPTNAKWVEDAYKVMDVGTRTESVLRHLAVTTALQEQLRIAGKTWQEVRAAGLEMPYLLDAVKTAERTQHEFGILGRSPYMHQALGNTGYHAVVQLGSYPYKQMQFLLRGMDKDPGLLLKYLAYSGITARIGAETAGVALGPAVGFGFMGPISAPRRNRPVPLSPPLEVLASSIDFGVALRSGNPTEVAAKRDAWQRSLEAMAPVGKQYETYARNMREAFAGKTEKFQDQASLVEVTKQLFTGKPEIKHVERELTTTKERIAHALGIQTIGDRVMQQQKAFKRQKSFDRIRRRQEAQEAGRARHQKYIDALDDYDKAIREGDFDSAHQIYRDAANAGVMNFSGVGEQAGREARFLRARLQFLKGITDTFLPEEEEGE